MGGDHRVAAAWVVDPVVAAQLWCGGHQALTEDARSPAETGLQSSRDY